MSLNVRTISTLMLCAFGIGLAVPQIASADVARKVEIYRMLADIYEKQSNASQAALQYRNLVGLAPHDAQAHYNFAMFMLRNRLDSKLAANEFKKACALDGSHGDWWANLGQAQLATKDYSGAQESYRKAGPQYAEKQRQVEQYIQQIRQIEQYNKNLQKQQQDQ